jgi:hypothetical protein
MLAIAMAVCVLAGGVLFAHPAGAADSSDAKTENTRVNEKRDKVKADKKARKEDRQARRDGRRENRKSFLSRLWPFGKDKEEGKSFPEQKRFGTGNPRDASQYEGVKKPVTTKVRSHKKAKRDGMHFTRPVKVKRGHASPSRGSSKDDVRTTHSHKNGEFRKATHKKRHAPTGLNWNLPKKRPQDKLNKDGKYRPSQ